MLTKEQQERVRLLVAALRSKKYRQGKYALSKYSRIAKRRKLCCLGVACEIARQNGLDLKIRTGSDGYRYYDRSHAVLPRAVQAWFGFDRSDPILINQNGGGSTASGLNDNAGYNFSQIADAFERTFLKDNNDQNT